MDTREQTFVSAVVYIRNNRDTIPMFFSTLRDFLDDRFEHYEIIAVDDRSTDGSADLVREACAYIRGSLTIVSMSFPQGVQLSMNAGVDIAIGDFVFEFDCCSPDFGEFLLGEMYERELEGYDVVCAVPNGKPRLMSRLFYKIYNRYANTKYPLGTGNIRLVSRRAINRIQAMSDNIPYRKAFYMNCGLPCDFMHYEPTCDYSKGSTASQRAELASDSLILFTDVAYKFSALMSAIMVGFTLLSGLYTLIIFILGKPIEGWTTTMLFMSFAFLGMFAILTIILKYLSVAIKLIFKKQSYFIESVQKL